MITIKLPYPPKELSSNDRVHWAQRATAMRDTKLIAMIETTNRLEELTKKHRKELSNTKSDLQLTVIFHPARRGIYDRDNALTRCKGYLDGIAAALGIDDSQFEPTTLRRGDVVKGGAVEFEIFL